MTPETSVIVLIDVQTALARLMHERARLMENLVRLLSAARVFALPILWLEQNPRHLGRTEPELCALLEGHTPIEKLSFSACGAPAFLAQLESLRRPTVILCGIETHVCIWQTARDLRARGYTVHVVSDAVASRTPHNYAIGLQRCAAAGAVITSTEMLLFELLATAAAPQFKDILRLVK
ncbi:MAG: hydrolase [bacterium]|nr:hydrolase [bacterium]